ncbi:hypothetical protein ACA910_000563 [Epithemia clementina (nom. ined.)]
MQSSQGGGMGAASMQDMQRLQQQLAQAQYQRQQQAPGGAGTSNAQMIGAGNSMNSQQFSGQFSSSMPQSQNRGGPMGNTGLAMMQQQQQNQLQQPTQQQGSGNGMQGSSGMASMFGSFGSVNQALLQGNSSSPMDASSGSSARLMAMAGMNVNQMNSSNMQGMANRPNSAMDSSSTMQNMQALMQQQQVQQAAVQKNQLQNPMGFGMQPQGQNSNQQMFNQSGSGSQSNLMMRSSEGGNQMNSQQMMLQQQLANLQQQMQGQQQNGVNQTATSRQGNPMMQSQTSSQNLLQQRQQQLLQQMQNQRRSSGMMNQSMSHGGLNTQQQGQDMNGNMGMMQQMMQQNNNNSSSSSNMGMSTSPQGGVGLTSMQNAQQNAALQGAFVRGPLTEQQLRIRQQNILRASVEQQAMNLDATQASQAGMPSVSAGVGSDHSTRSNSNIVGGSSNNNSSSNMANDGNSYIGSGMDGSSGPQQQRISTMVRQSSSQIPEISGGLNDSSTHSHSTRGGMSQQLQTQNAMNSSIQGVRTMGQQPQKSFLDGNFAGGWQSNADLPDRRKVIFSILEVIKQMRPNSNTTSTKLPHMAKSLEEHLYRSAQTKEEYLDSKTLKQRLQTIAQGLDLHRAPGSVPGGSPNQGPFGQMDVSRNSQQSDNQGNNWAGNNAGQGLSMMQQQQMHGNNMQQMQGNNSASNIVDPWDGGSRNGDQDMSMMNMQHPGQDVGGRNQSVSWNNSGTVDMNNTNPIQGEDPMGERGGWSQQMGGMEDRSDHNQLMNNGQDMNQVGDGSMINPGYPNTPKFQDAEAAQKRKVILQQQQRLLLLRHASKCKNGPACTTKFCNQMVTLWKHMKTCRDKNCKTSHCLSSRCVLNHYRICKSQGKTATCEVCGPVMAKIKQNGREDGVGDPLAHGSQHQDQQVLLQQQQHQSETNMASLAARMMPNQRPPSSLMQQGMQQQAPDNSLSRSDDIIQENQLGDMAQMAIQGNQNQMAMQGNQMAMMNSGNSQEGNPTMVGSGVFGNSDQTEQNQLQQLQQHQMKMQQQLEALKHLQGQQQQLLDQQGRLQEQSQLISDMNSPQAQQLRQQQLLLDQLQKRCQQQQLRLQQEIETQSQPSGLVQAVQEQVQSSTSASPNPSQHIESPPVNVPSTTTSNASSAGMDESASKRKRRASTTEKPARRQSGKAKRGGGKGKALRQQLLETKSGEAKATLALMKSEAFAKKKALSQLNPKERAQKKRSAKAELAPLAGETSSLISFMPRDMIMRHLESLNKRIRLSSRTVTHKCMPVVQALIDDQFGWVFHDPVDPVALGLPDYFDVVKNPMHLALVKKKLESAIYADMELFARDVRLVFENAILYNGESSEVGELAQTMLHKFDGMFRELVQGVESSQHNLESNGQACSLCGNQTRRYEPAVLYCRGKCGMQRIKRGATYFVDRTKSSYWCQACYGGLLPDDGLVLDDGSEIRKTDLHEFTNDALPEEAWVNCDECQCWVHQVCALFNDRTNRSNAKYTCPNCVLKRGDVVGFPVAGQKFAKGAEDLERSNMSDAIEEGLQKVLAKAYTDRAKELGVDVDTVERANELTVRVISSVEKNHSVGEEMIRRYGSSGCPTEYPVRSKCVALFQKIHGVDTMLFAMYVYEYGHDCPAPNRRRVYISYVDSVQYFEPKCYRTLVYHTILLEYLRYVKGRGFHTAHIWSCPPTPGDDYIFYIHPSHQLFPREDMLRAWYHKVLDKAKAEGIVIRTSTLYDEYFNNDTARPEAAQRDDPLCVPYFEGDYIPGEIENIIRHLNEKGIEREEGVEDEVMKRLRHNIGKMKDNFIVVHLRNRRFAAAVERGDDVSSWPEDSDEELIRSKRAKISGKEARLSFNHKPSSGVSSEGPSDSEAKAQGSASDSKKPDSQSAKRSFHEIEPAIASHMAKLGRQSAVVRDTKEDDPSVESDLFESRQQFLNYCQTNHCQFDELRRVKHSTLMVLFQLHNPTAPKFLQQCSACYRDITHGYRYHCDVCTNFDICEDCYEPVTSGMWSQKDDRYKHDKSHTFTSIDLDGTDEASKSGEEREESLKAHINLLEHAGKCSGSPGCQLQNCEKMKRLFEHVETCDVRPKIGCKICTRLLSLCVLHARLCPVRGECPIPFCDRIRERNQRVRRQQQLMDERRRLAQNELYHTGSDGDV